MNLKEWIESHGYKVARNADNSIVIFIEVLNTNNRIVEIERHEVRNIQEARIALGY